MKKRYRLVEQEDLETTPVQWVAVHPVRWHQHPDQPQCGFVEDDSFDDLLAACEAARDAIASLPVDSLGVGWVSATLPSGESGQEAYPIRDELVARLTAEIAKFKGEYTP